MEETVTISAKEYEALKARDDELSLLEAAGVDNWEWYGDALKGHMDGEWTSRREDAGII